MTAHLKLAIRLAIALKTPMAVDITRKSFGKELHLLVVDILQVALLHNLIAFIFPLVTLTALILLQRLLRALAILRPRNLLQLLQLNLLQLNLLQPNLLQPNLLRPNLPLHILLRRPKRAARLLASQVPLKIIASHHRPVGVVLDRVVVAAVFLSVTLLN